MPYEQFQSSQICDHYVMLEWFMMQGIFEVCDKISVLCPFIFYVQNLPRCFLRQGLVQEALFKVNVNRPNYAPNFNCSNNK
jgi:hypothetical protein